MLESAWGWIKEKLAGLGLAFEIVLILLMLMLGWYLGGFWFLAAILGGMAVLAAGAK